MFVSFVLGAFARLKAPAYKNAPGPPLLLLHLAVIFLSEGIYGKNRLFQAEGQKWVLRSQLLMSKTIGEKKQKKLCLEPHRLNELLWLKNPLNTSVVSI